MEYANLDHWVAKTAYYIADSMLEARKRIKPSTIATETGAGAASDSPHDGLTDAQRLRHLLDGLMTAQQAQRKDVKP